MSWSTDISAAPRGKRVTVRKIGKNGKVHAQTVTEHEPVWLATKCGVVTKAHWLWPRKLGQYGTQMSAARWNMLSANEKPLAWRPFIEGEFPRIVTKGEDGKDVITYPNGAGPEYPHMILGVAA